MIQDPIEQNVWQTQLELADIAAANVTYINVRDVTLTLRTVLQAEACPFEYQISWIKTPGYAPSPCHTTGIFRPLPGSRHFKLQKA